LGESGVGKTTVVHRFTKLEFRADFKATIGCDFSLMDVTVRDQVVDLQIWDTAGQERFDSIVDQLFHGAEACVLVFDVTNPRSFELLSRWRRQVIDKLGIEEPEKFPFVVFANKVDLLPTASGAVSIDRVRESIEEEKMPFFEVSALTGQNIEAGFTKVAELYLESQQGVVRRTSMSIDAGALDKRGCHC
jgi:Ras-related protein Rab-7A